MINDKVLTFKARNEHDVRVSNIKMGHCMSLWFNVDLFGDEKLFELSRDEIYSLFRERMRKAECREDLDEMTAFALQLWGELNARKESLLPGNFDAPQEMPE